jgi:hypothetical protein
VEEPWDGQRAEQAGDGGQTSRHAAVFSSDRAASSIVTAV